MAQQVKKNNNNNHFNVGNIKTQEGFEELNNTQENTETLVETPRIEDVLVDSKDKEIEQLKKENADKNAQIDSLTKNFEAMQAQLNLLLAQNLSQAKTSQPAEKPAIVGCRSVYGDSLSTKDDSLAISFLCDEEKEIDADDLRTLLKESNSKLNKKLFEEDIFYFVDPDDYARFKIKKRIDLSPENLTRILFLDTNSMIGEVATITNNLNPNEHQIIRNFQFGVVKLLIDKNNPLEHWPFKNRESLELYLGLDFNTLLASVGVIELLGRKKFS